MQKIVITDIGSTTTKALLLLEDENNEFNINAINHAETTVEKPDEDVKIGVYQAVKELESQSKISLLSSESSPQNLSFADDVKYFTTSSAGGGLQILVVGLTLFDSASSAKRAAYGAGGVLLDVFAIDDKRNNLEKINLIKILHPDIILFSGGTDDGAVVPIIRLGEILMLGSPSPKFSLEQKLPLIFAGNKEVQTYIKDLFADDYDLHIVPNIRPKLDEENLKPARDKIHQLFMENVMEQAPGYSELKDVVNHDIIPTPSGVLNSLQILSDLEDENILAVDIGGATTDIFSKMLNRYNRTVSANFGMSYSIANVMKESGFDNVRRWIPNTIDDNFVRNYISNKMLNPTMNPQSDKLICIEHAIAREAFRMAKDQHLDMNFNTKRIGFLDRLKSSRKNKFTEKLYYADNLEEEIFSLDDFDTFIGAGGVISHTKNKLQAFEILASGLQARGITKICRDKFFVSPHLGKFAEINQEIATDILQNQVIEELGMIIRPFSLKWKEGKAVINLTINNKKRTYKAGDYVFIKNENGEELNVSFEMHKGYAINTHESGNFKTKLPIIIDVTLPEEDKFAKINNQLSLYDFSDDEKLEDVFSTASIAVETGEFSHSVKMSYEGDINVKKGDDVKQGDLLAINKFDPPMIYILTLFDKEYLYLNKNNVKEHLLLNVGDELNVGQKIANMHAESKWKKIMHGIDGYYSSVRGIVESINYDVGTIIVREIQDYDTKPHKVEITSKLKMKPKNIMGALKKFKGEFVHRNDVLAKGLVDKMPVSVVSPFTGTIKEIDKEKGYVIVQYDQEPYKTFSMINGKVKEVIDNKEIVLSYQGAKFVGKIGFGKDAFGKLKIISDSAEIDNLTSENIVFWDKKISYETLLKLADQDIAGLIVPGIDNSEVIKFLGDEIGIALTGNEQISYPIILLEGFGDFKTPQNFQKLFTKKEGQKLCMIPHTQIRAGVSRPQIIFS